MTQDEIIEMAKEAHRKLVTEVYVGHMGQLNLWEIELLKIFAKLVAAKLFNEKKHWVGLAAEDRLTAKYMQDSPDGIEAVIDYIEAKLKERNT